MSELKTLMCAHEPDVRPMYDKFEADKIIAELEADCAYWKTMSRKCADDNEVMAKQRADAFKREHHHKYKRCLAMAMLCRSFWAANVFIHGGSDRMSHYMKWQKRWMELAEKFKEAK